MRRFSLKLAAACALAATSISTAFAHANLERPEAAPGSYKAVLRIPHGCDGKPTDTVRIEIPEGYIGVKPMPKAGWTTEIEKGDYAREYDLHGKKVSSGVKAVTWKGGDLPDEFYDEFVVSGSLAGVEGGQKLLFVTRQKCGDAELVWSEVATEGQDPHSLEHPAPALTIVAAEQHGHGHGAAAPAADAGGAGDIELTGGWARAMLPGQPTGGAYVTITNKGAEADRLVGASSPAAGKVEVHTMTVVNDVMTMRPAEGGLEIPAGGAVELKPGGFHLMFMQVSQPFQAGGEVPVTLEFERAGKVELVLPVSAAKAPAGHHSGHGG
jgi:periplasmic copper chaperone A